VRQDSRAPSVVSLGLSQLSGLTQPIAAWLKLSLWPDSAHHHGLIQSANVAQLNPQVTIHLIHHCGQIHPALRPDSTHQGGPTQPTTEAW